MLNQDRIESDDIDGLRTAERVYMLRTKVEIGRTSKMPGQNAS